MNIPPIRATGSVGNVFRTSQFADDEREYNNQSTVTMRGDSFIWQPWFITVDGGVNLTLESDRGGTSESDSTVVTGNIDLGILPFSRYPSTLGYSRQDSSIEGDNFSDDFVRNRFSATNRAIISTDLRTFAGVSYTDIQQDDGSETDFNASFDVTKNFDADSLTLGLEHDSRDFQSEVEEDVEEMTNIATVRYFSNPFPDANLQSTTFLLHEDEDGETRGRERLSLQGISTAQWRPREWPFTMNGALRTRSEQVEITGTGSGTTTENLVSGTLGVNYPIRPRLTTNAGVTGDFRSIERDRGTGGGDDPLASRTTIGATVLGSIAYISLPMPLGGFVWRWNSGANADVTYETEQDLEPTAGVNAGHTFDRTFQFPLIGPVQFTANESGLVEYNEDEEIVPNVSHSVSLTHSSGTEGGFTLIRLSALDNRDLAGSDMEEFQLVEMQVSRQSAIDLRSQWRAGLSVQFSRRKEAGEDADFLTTANGIVSYSARDVLGFRDLTFSSTLELDAVGFGERIGIDERSQDRSRSQEEAIFTQWTNILGYRIGRVFAGIEGRVFMNQEELGNSLLFRIRRDFGGIF